jgi:DNA modification methylase
MNNDNYQLHSGDCLELLATLPDNSVDSIVTDPPYGLSFMGKKWDYDVPKVEIWKECLRVLKPGGHLLAFAGTRTQHRMAVRIEDAGFEIRDMIAWVYGSGFPKSLDVSKAIDKAAGVERDVLGVDPVRFARLKNQINGSVSTGEQWEHGGRDVNLTATATEAAKQWSGWGTALKPSLESLTVATKPLDPLGHCSKMIENLTKGIESCRQNASNAEKSSRHTQAELTEARANTVLENAAIPIAANLVNGTETGRVDDISSKVDTLALAQEQEHTALSTFLSWKNTLVGVLNAMKMSTTGTAFETITDWKILSFCLSQITPDTITKAKFNPSGLNVDVLRATEYLNVSLALLQNTLALSVLAPAMSQEAENCRGVDVKPNLNPCIMARKPLIGTVAENVLAHGTGALNVDGCRVEGAPPSVPQPVFNSPTGRIYGMKTGEGRNGEMSQAAGRWPANLIHDGSEEVLAAFPQAPGQQGDLKETGRPRPSSGRFGDMAPPHAHAARIETDKSAARFFYCAKASKRDRDEGNNHPTVKPTELMRYLCRLVTPPGGVVLDPFTGSGSTGKAAILEGFRFLGAEMNPEYVAIAKARIDAAVSLL